MCPINAVITTVRSRVRDRGLSRLGIVRTSRLFAIVRDGWNDSSDAGNASPYGRDRGDVVHCCAVQRVD